MHTVSTVARILHRQHPEPEHTPGVLASCARVRVRARSDVRNASYKDNRGEVIEHLPTLLLTNWVTYVQYACIDASVRDRDAAWNSSVRLLRRH